MNDQAGRFGMYRPISRRDFCQGVALALGTLPLLDPSFQALAAVAGPDYYPPALPGLRGSHVGSFEIAHALAREGTRFPMPTQQTGPTYDLVVVGGGISGLASAWYYRQRRPGANILILDNHDDFGGHAKRNEFHYNGRTILAHGGSQNIDTPAAYSPEAGALLRELGIDVDRFYGYFDQDLHNRWRLSNGVLFDAAHFGDSRLIVSGGAGWDVWSGDMQALADQAPLNAQARADLIRLFKDERDYLPHLARDGKIEFLKKISYDDFLLKIVGVHPDVVELMQAEPNGLWGVGTDALSAIEMYREGYPGFAAMDLGHVRGMPEVEQPYIFHFPDGNASIARLLVRELIPGVAPGHSMEDIVTARVDYGMLDREDAPVRIRLNSTAVRVTQDRDRVDINYVQGGETFRVASKHAVLACYHRIVPYLCPELPEEQRKALSSQVKVPLLWTNVLIDNWRALARLGVSGVDSPKAYYSWMMLDFPVSMGGYRFGSEPGEPAVLLLIRCPNAPGRGLSPKEQYRLGRQELLSTDFATFEYETRRQLGEMLGPGGFDPALDIKGITLNRWPHGYAYEYAELWDPEWEPGQAPHQIARRSWDRIAIANSDADARAYVDAAIDAAYRAVNEIKPEA
ncbi:MAG: FAD-dependent oxidoreductase [Burkholderiales bacterium]